MMRNKAKPIALGVALATAAVVLTAAIVGCGESKPKRAVDARTEVLRFFAVDAPAVALLQPEPSIRVAEMNRGAAGVPAWDRLRGAALGPLHAAGLRGSDLSQLGRPMAEIEGVDAAALALGSPTPASLASGGPLLVLATDQRPLLARLFLRAAERGRLRTAGRLDEALLYRGHEAAYAVRDGVLVSAPRLTEVRAAIERRDGDSDQQLDEDVVKSLFDDLRIEGSLLVYANLQSVRDTDPGLRALASRVPWIGQLGQVAASAEPLAGSVRLEVAAKAPGGDLEASELPLGVAPTRFTLSSANAAGLLPGDHADPVRRLLLSLAPLAGKATASSDEVRAETAVSP
jgi:hypothetical protein